MVDSTVVLWGQTMAYTLYCLAILVLIGWFAYKVTRPKKQESNLKNGLFYAFVSMLVILGVSLHIVTYNTIPWAPLDLNRSGITPDKVIEIGVQDHKFILPHEKIVVNCKELVLFNVTSNDLTYGFGLFRQDNSMVFQMQVVPGHRNDIIWQFEKAEVLTIRSTEYSGPEGVNMIVKDAVTVVCN
jgi:cytochrome c oxidase subunit 2